MFADSETGPQYQEAGAAAPLIPATAEATARPDA